MKTILTIILCLLLIACASDLSEIIQLLETGDFRGGIFNQTEDNKFIDLLFDIREGNTQDLLCHVTGCEQITGGN